MTGGCAGCRTARHQRRRASSAADATRARVVAESRMKRKAGCRRRPAGRASWARWWLCASSPVGPKISC